MTAEAYIARKEAERMRREREAERLRQPTGIRRRNNDDLIGYDEISGGLRAAAAYGKQLAGKVVEGADRKLREAPRAGEVALDPSGKAYDGGDGTKVYKGKGKHGETVYSDSGYDPLMYGKETSAETKKFLAENPAIAANFARDRAPGAKRMDERLAAVREQMNTPKMTMDDFLKQAQAENMRVRSKLALGKAELEAAQTKDSARAAEQKGADDLFASLVADGVPLPAAVGILARQGYDPMKVTSVIAAAEKAAAPLRKQIAGAPLPSITNYGYDRGFKPSAGVDEYSIPLEALNVQADNSIDGSLKRLFGGDPYTVTAQGMSPNDDLADPMALVDGNTADLDFLRTLADIRKRLAAAKTPE